MVACFTFFQYHLNISESIPSAAKSAGIATVTPILRKSVYPNFKLCSLRIELHIMPAKAPIGVRQAPKLEPTTVAYTAASVVPPERMAEYKTLMGMLLMRFADTKDVTP